MISEKAKKQIRGFQGALGDHDTWLHSGEEKFYELAGLLVKEGFTEDDAVNFLLTAYCIVANEYGD